MPKLYIPVGIPGCGKPGCGKSTLSKNILGATLTHSTDAIRERVTSDINDQSQNKDVFEIFHREIGEALASGRNSIADATNLRRFARTRLRFIAEEHNAETHVIVFTNIAQAVARNLARTERIVPADVMIRMIDQYHQAIEDLRDEAYDSVTYIENVA